MAILHPGDATNQGVTLLGPLVDRALAHLDAGIHVHIVGPHFSGRTALLREIGVRLVENGRNILRIDGNPAWRDEPFGALVAARLVKEPHPRLLGEALAALDKLVAARQPIIMSDDTANLDTRSAGALIASLRDAGLPTVTVDLATGQRVPNPFGAALAPAISVRMGTLGFTQLQELATSVLGAPLGPLSVSKLAFESGGLFGLARALLVIGREVGAIQERADGIYRVAGTLWSTDLLWLAERLVDTLDDDLMDAAVRLASMGPLPVPDAVRILGTDTLDALLAAGLAHRTEYNNGATIGLYPGLLISYLRHEHETYWPAAGWTDPDELRMDLTAELQNLDTGLIAQQFMNEAADRAKTLRAEWDAEPTPQHALPLLVALLDSSAPEGEIDRVIHGTQLTGPAPTPALFLARAARWLASRNREDEALALLRDYRANNPSSDAILRAVEAQTLLTRNQRPPTSLLAPAGPEDHPFGAEMLTDTRIQLALCTAKTRTALDLLASFTPTFSYVSERKPVWQLLADVFSGNIMPGVAVALKQLRSSKRLLTADATEVYGYAALMALYASGRCHEAYVVLQNILATSLSSTSHSAFHAGTLTLGALIAGREGDGPTAVSLSAQAEASSKVPGPYPGMTAAVVREIFKHLSDNAANADELWRLVSERLDRGFVLSAFNIAVDAVEYGPDTYDTIPRLRALMTEVESPLVETMGRYVFAVADEDTDELATVVAAFAGFGAMLYATKAMVTLALMHRRQGDIMEALDMADEAWKCATETGHEGPSLFARLRDDIGLSDREREIMGYVADGMSYADIASLLDLSARTVETHLLNVARKVGAPGRRRLVDAVQTWLKPPPT